jgi:hypothetical protein
MADGLYIPLRLHPREPSPEIDAEPATTAVSSAPPLSLSPARSQLAAAQDSVRRASEALATAQQPVDRLSKLINDHTALVRRLAERQTADEAGLGEWLKGGCERPRPRPSAETSELQREVEFGAQDVAAAQKVLADLQPSAQAAAERVRDAHRRRDEALAWAAVEAARERAAGFLDKLNQALVEQAMLEGLARELMTKGNAHDASPAFVQASIAISELITATRRDASAQPNPDAAQRLLAALTSNASAVLE